ncbi:hypothetical protein I316_02218 [Kwoniella heveanensis BCC8398]|uniref:3-keto-disaccharide hydrolase domain-containing protein n=1 Tax=Kwoniella heveanensis BCC8398 TaxID=1296120 RepID=A0A1B9GZ88_9TREE|nr:hypothetical protein I316_02218 [Kwoniella heveanensis BCC8398]
MTSIPFADPRWTTLNPPPPSSAKESTPTPSDDGIVLRWKTVGETDWWRTPEADRHSGLVYGFEHTFEADKGFEISVELGVEPKVQLPDWLTDLSIVDYISPSKYRFGQQSNVPQYLPSLELSSSDDQAALFLRLDDKEQTWVKTGLEFENDKLWAGVVVSSPYSDWSLLPPPVNAKPRRFTISLAGMHLRVFLNDDMIRQVNAFGPSDEHVDATSGNSKQNKAFVGVMACSPKTGGAEVSFNNFQLAGTARE